MTPRLQDAGPFEGHPPEQARPLGGYGLLAGSFAASAGVFAGWLARSGRDVPERMEARDLALVALATHKAARLLAKDRVTCTVRAPFSRFEADAGPGEVSEAARGRGLRRAIGELIICPYCLGVWIAAALTAGLLVAPCLTHRVAAVLNAVFAADVLQIV
jgi:hypothetical protein